MRKTVLMFLLCVFGTALNVMFNKVFAGSGMGLPLYMDTILTITVTFIGGLFWGCLTGVLTNIAGHTMNFWGWEGYLFSLCNILTALITWKFTRIFLSELTFINGKNEKENPQGASFFKSRRLDNIMSIIFVLMLLSFILCFAISVMGGLIASFIDVIKTPQSENPASQHSDFYSGLPLVLREIVSRVPINIIDRIISVFAGFGIAYAIGKVVSKVRKSV
jgi:Na+-transporting methylmalonyl-CoA/oxaloacetate decarboxylase gamma subunit